MDFARQLLKGLMQAWGRLSSSARVNLALAGAATVLVIVLTVFMSSRPQYVRLYDHLDPAEAAKIVELLQQEGVDYKLQDGEQTVLVPLRDRSRMKMAAAAKSLPTSQGAAPGFEAFKEQDLLANRWLQDVRYMRAVQGELQRQLNEFDFVNKSFVFIREADEELFISQQKPSKAAVTLDLKRPLSKNEIKAVLNTVSSFGGAHLNLNNITLVATDGTVLHLPPSSDFASIANSNLEYVAELERQREARAMQDFERLGVRALVRVSAVVDFDSSTETSTKTEDGAVISAYTTTTKTTSSESLPQGAPGATANMPTEGMVNPATGQTTDTSEETIENFQPSSTETKTVKQPGKVKQYIVSAILEGETRKSTDANGKEIEEYVGLTPEKKKIYEDYISAAVGQGETPTKITVNDQPFTITKLTEAKEAFQAIEGAKWVDTLMEWGGRVIQAGLIVFLFFLARRFLMRAVVTPTTEEPEPEQNRPSLSPEDLQREQINTEVAKLSQENPEAVVALLRTWMAQDED